MSDYLISEESLSFDYDATLEVVTTDNQKLGLASSGTASLVRPDKIRVTRTGGFVDLELVFNGEIVSLLSKHAGVYAQKPMTGDIDDLMDGLRSENGFALPAADLLAANPYDVLMSEVLIVTEN